MARTASELLCRLFEYAEESLRQVDLGRYLLTNLKSNLLTPDKFQGLPGVSFDVQRPGDHIWMRVERLEEKPRPALPGTELDSVIHVTDNPDREPVITESLLKSLISNKAASSPQMAAEIGELVRIQAASVLADYMVLWEAWAQDERPRRTTIDLYSELFAIKRQIEIQQGTDAVEMVWGLGVSSWKLKLDDQEHDFQYPLLTQALELHLDEETFAIEIRPRAVDPQCEMEAFIATNVHASSECESQIRDYISKHTETPMTPFMPSSYLDVLKLAVRTLDSRGRFVTSPELTYPAPGPDLIVSDAWAVFLRPKPTNYLIADLKNIRRELEQGAEIPDGPLALVTPPSDTPVTFEDINFRGISSRGISGANGAPRDLYFPLPYNDEQVTIVQRLERAAGVAVQGPPGTGKTHTIANIICHYLAQGKRILVTSKGEQALQVLQSKIPEEVRPLTVALLTSDREGQRQFKGSIEAIQHEVSQINPTLIKEQIRHIHQAIDQTNTELVLIDRKIDEIARSQLSKITVDGQHFSAQELAQRVMDEFEEHDWFLDELTLEDRHAPPLSVQEGEVLRATRCRLGDDLIYVTKTIPSSESMPAAQTVAELHESLCRIHALEGAVGDNGVPDLKNSSPGMRDAVQDMITLIDQATGLLESIEKTREVWPQDLRRVCAKESFSAELSALDARLNESHDLLEARVQLINNFVEFPDEGLGCSKTREAVNRAVETGKPFGFLSIGAGDAKQHVSAIKVNGLAPSTAEDWGLVQSYLQLHADSLMFTTRWNHVAKMLEIPQLEGGINNLRKLQEITSAVRDALDLGINFDPVLPAKSEGIFGREIEGLDFASVDLLSVVRGYLNHHLARMELSGATAALASLQATLAGKSGPVAFRLRTFVAEELGKPEVTTATLTAHYADHMAELRRIESLAGDLDLVRQYAALIKDAGAEQLALLIRNVPAEGPAEDSVFRPTWREAWTWSRIQTHLDSIEGREELRELNKSRVSLETGLAKMYREVVSKAAWLATKNNASPKVLQALQGYANAIRRIGQGTGPNAERYRRDAQQCMEQASEAVPCWIMSHAKISESMPADIGAFDLVIVDEASQSDLWALPAIVRAKKVLVVGDDKQVSPSGGFKSAKRISELRERFLNDQPYGAEMTVEKSLYDLASRVFADAMVMLREHFRCVPAIITYSNRFYNGAIQPLRLPRASERLDPPLIDVFIKNGVKDKRGCNQLEAEFIAAEISAILADESMAGRSIGVVSLLSGHEQNKYIDTLVRERCPAAELQKRDFACGDASTFQGSERDIIFLSMIADPENCHPLSDVTAEQRFNVAASRARDRMYLVRSVTLEHLSTKDLRRTLVEYFNKPIVAQEVDQQGLIKLCESYFEEDVFTRLVERGYRVIPQVKSGAYRLDLVVEGGKDNRLAIELDGDAYHGPDRWEQDMNRQRVLERAGWTFWRCFASSWVMNKEEIFEELVQRLTSMGIEPIGALEKLPSVVEYREWAPAVELEWGAVTDDFMVEREQGDHQVRESL